MNRKKSTKGEEVHDAETFHKPAAIPTGFWGEHANDLEFVKTLPENSALRTMQV